MWGADGGVRTPRPTGFRGKASSPAVGRRWCGGSWQVASGLLAGLLVLLFTGQRAVFDEDEGFELAKAHSVAAGAPLYSAVWCDHPPLHNLMLRGLYQFTGESAGAARVLVALFSALLVGGVHGLCARLAGARVAMGAVGLFLVLAVNDNYTSLPVASFQNVTKIEGR